VIDEDDVREMLHRRAGAIFAMPSEPEAAVRRARRRLVRSGLVGAVATVLLIVGVLFGVRALDLLNRTTPAEPSPPPILHEGEVLELAGDGVTLVATDTVTRDERALVRCTDCAYIRRFAPSAGGRWIAYEALTCDGACQSAPPGAGLWIVGAQGSRIHVTTTAGGVWAWSPTTERFAFVGTRMHGTKLILLDPATGERTSIATAGGSIYALAWSPDGSTIAYSATSLVGIIVVRPGSSPEMIEGSSIEPACCDAIKGVDDLVWSPDGTRLAVISNDRGDRGVTVVRIDGSGWQTVLDHRAQYIAWSPDGRRIAFVIRGHDVGVVWASGGVPWILANGHMKPGIWSRLVWSPDGRLVAFTQGFGRQWYAVPADDMPPAVPADVSSMPPPHDVDRLEVERWMQGVD
jgi:hypothetical protein